MSSYIDHHSRTADARCRSPLAMGALGHSWADFTHQRLFWLYGGDRAWEILKGSDHATNIDVGKWQALGRKDAA